MKGRKYVIPNPVIKSTFFKFLPYLSASGLKFIETEESDSSKTSFLGDDFRPLYGEKPRRVETIRKKKEKTDGLGRGQYQTADGIRIKSDCI